LAKEEIISGGGAGLRLPGGGVNPVCVGGVRGMEGWSIHL